MGIQNDSLVSDPAEFPRLLVNTIAKQLDENRAIQKIARNMRGGAGRRPVKFSVGLPWLVNAIPSARPGALSMPVTA